jgi:hypothetical protein
MFVRDIGYLENLDQSLSVSGGRRWRSHRSFLIGEGSLKLKRHGQVPSNRSLSTTIGQSEVIGVSFSLGEGPSVSTSELSEVTRSGIFRSAFAAAGFSQNGSTFSYSASAVSV